ncbi:molybdate ABC transporter substrate-binding protein [Cellulosilyticum ruminicola]|uniref:molybdate ABC transporter substrate-binding protein n=1 Tax=Cellulosilyticum ruminicola TaxID=425254 RepID=UPI0006D23BCF|nr:molybdate ABC transporter substrate-binding protein [Cellulosilyticum ruminicola]
MKGKFWISTLVMMVGMSTLAGCGSISNTNQNMSQIENPVEKVKIQVFIAASLKNAMTTVQKDYKEIHPEVEIVFNADSSRTLQTQIEEGASCDVFFSAAMKQMNALTEEGLVEEDTNEKLLENKVVLIKPIGEQTKVTGFENVTEASNIVLAREDVPAGTYAREIFTNLGNIDDVKSMEINEGANVTAVLAAVSEGSNEVGVVYATDAASVKDKVEIIAEAPVEALASPVIYPVACIKNEEASEAEHEAAQEFVKYLSTNEAMKVFEKYGFVRYNP